LREVIDAPFDFFRRSWWLPVAFQVQAWDVCDGVTFLDLFVVVEVGDPSDVGPESVDCFFQVIIWVRLFRQYLSPRPSSDFVPDGIVFIVQ